jgi:sugar lactone lactonase YvrE
MLAAGCPAPGQTGARPTVKKPRTNASPAIVVSASPDGPAVSALGDSLRVVGPSDGTQNTVMSAVKLIGKVKLISDKGLGIISNNSGSLVSNNGGSLITNGGGNYVTLQAGGTSAVPESLLAEARIEVVDAEGNLLVDPDRKPISAISDATGAFRFEAALPKENLTLRVNLFPNGGNAASGGQLLLMLPLAGATGPYDRQQDLDYASTLGAAYVLDTYVKKLQPIYDRLPAAEADALDADMEAARAALGDAVPSYKRQALVATAESLRGKAPTLDATLTRIENILLIGQKDLGNGLPATQATLVAPTAIVGDNKGNLYVAEYLTGRIRKIDAQGVITQVAIDPSTLLSPVAGMALGPDGALYLAEPILNQVRKLNGAGKLEVVAGTGSNLNKVLGKPGSQTPLDRPAVVTFGPDGALYIGEAPKGNVTAGRILKLDKGIVTEVKPLPVTLYPMYNPTSPIDHGNEPRYEGLAFKPDGTLFAVSTIAGLLTKLGSGGEWSIVEENLRVRDGSHLAVGPDGTLYMCDTENERVVAYSPTGVRSVFAGTGTAGHTADGAKASGSAIGGPTGIWVASDGTVYFAEIGNGLIRKVGKDGILHTVAGTTGASQTGDTGAIALNGPAGLTRDPQGRVLVAETGTHLVKRIDGTTLTVVAGTVKGTGGDGGPATAAQFNVPSSLAYIGNDLYVNDSDNYRIRKIDASGNITTVAGDGVAAFDVTWPATFPALGRILLRPMQMAVGPDKTLYWAEAKLHQVHHLLGAEVAAVAGDPGRAEGYAGDGGLASASKLKNPSGLAFDSKGNMYIADTSNLVVRKVTPSGAMSRYAGTQTESALAKIFTYKPGSDEGGNALDTLLFVPVALTFDADDNLFVAELGTVKLSLVGNLTSVPTDLFPKVTARIRKITPDGKITTVAGVGGKVLTDVEGENSLSAPLSLVIDGEGRMVISDTGSNQLKILPKGSF